MCGCNRNASRRWLVWALGLGDQVENGRFLEAQVTKTGALLWLPQDRGQDGTQRARGVREGHGESPGAAGLHPSPPGGSSPGRGPAQCSGFLAGFHSSAYWRLLLTLSPHGHPGPSCLRVFLTSPPTPGSSPYLSVHIPGSQVWPGHHSWPMGLSPRVSCPPCPALAGWGLVRSGHPALTGTCNSMPWEERCAGPGQTSCVSHCLLGTMVSALSSQPQHFALGASAWNASHSVTPAQVPPPPRGPPRTSRCSQA